MLCLIIHRLLLLLKYSNSNLKQLYNEIICVFPIVFSHETDVKYDIGCNNYITPPTGTKTCSKKLPCGSVVV